MKAHYVILPWGHVQWVASQSARPWATPVSSVDHVARLPARRPPPLESWPSQGAPGPTAPLVFPNVPPELGPKDREDASAELLLGAAVLLDVVATRLRPIEPHPTVLADAVTALAETATWAGRAPHTVNELLHVAEGTTGAERQRMGRALAKASAGDLPGLAPNEVPTEAASVERVHDALACVQRLAACLIHEVRLRLAAEEGSGDRAV